MIKIKNTKSDKELVAHDYKDGKVIFNPGSQTGAKKSDYMFNDMTMPIPGSNFQVTIKPQQEIEINADNSIQDIALQSIAKEIGATVDNIQPPHTVDMIVTETGSVIWGQAPEITITSDITPVMESGQYVKLSEDSVFEAEGAEGEFFVPLYTESELLGEDRGITVTPGVTITIPANSLFCCFEDCAYFRQTGSTGDYQHFNLYCWYYNNVWYGITGDAIYYPTV